MSWGLRADRASGPEQRLRRTRSDRRPGEPNGGSSAGPRAGVLAFGAVLLGLAWAAAGAQEPPSPRTGFFIGLTGQMVDVRGDFENGLTLWHFDKAFYVPRLENDFAPGLSLGYKRESGLWELGYVRSGHRAYWDGGESQAHLDVLELNGWWLPWPRLAVQPYVLLGLSLSRLVIQDGARMGGTVSDAAYTGLGVNLGAGLLLNLGTRLFFSGGVKYRYMGFFYVNGGGKGRDITDLTVGHGGPQWGKWLKAPSLGLAFGFGVRL
jgi:hypothetical protein